METKFVLPVRLSVGEGRPLLVGYITCDDFLEVPPLLRGLLDEALSAFESGAGDVAELRKWEAEMTEPDWDDDVVYDDDVRPEGENAPAHEDDGHNPGLDEGRVDEGGDDDGVA